jgi:hypothetical protein
MRREALVLTIGIIIFGLTAAILSACAGTTPPLATTQVCLPLKTYTPEQQAAVSAALKALPSDSPLPEFIGDFGAMRAADRACLASSKGSK